MRSALVAAAALLGLTSCSVASPNPQVHALATTATTAPPRTTPTRPTTTVPVVRPPAPIRATPWTSQPGDGVWMAAGRKVGPGPAVFITTLHQSGEPVGVAWMDTKRLRFALYAGSSQPPGSWPNDLAVPASLWGSLVATMNSGFRLNQSKGGWYLDGVTAVPLRTGAASFVVFRDGSATVGEWGRDAALSPSVVAVRQNLSLLVDGGAPTPAAASPTPALVWGAPYQGNVVTWRSAIGVDRAGHVLYVAGPAMNPETLAAVMVAAGAIRAMELDINPLWDNFDYFQGPAGALQSNKLLPVMSFPTDHFLHPYWRDFIAVFARAQAG